MTHNLQNILHNKDLNGGIQFTLQKVRHTKYYSSATTRPRLVLAHFVAEVLLVTIRPGLHKQRGGRDVTLDELQVEPIRLRLRSALREHPATKPRGGHSRSS